MEEEPIVRPISIDLTESPCQVLAPPRETSPEEKCLICSGGGVLIRCDECNCAYHLHCLEPPLKCPPEGHWRCPVCVDGFMEAALSRNEEAKATSESATPCESLRRSSRKRRATQSAPLVIYQISPLHAGMQQLQLQRTPEQEDLLLEAFLAHMSVKPNGSYEHRHLGSKECRRIAQEGGMTEHMVLSWFMETRQSWRRFRKDRPLKHAPVSLLERIHEHYTALKASLADPSRIQPSTETGKRKAKKQRNALSSFMNSNVAKERVAPLPSGMVLDAGDFEIEVGKVCCGLCLRTIPCPTLICRECGSAYHAKCFGDDPHFVLQKGARANTWICPCCIHDGGPSGRRIDTLLGYRRVTLEQIQADKQRNAQLHQDLCDYYDSGAYVYPCWQPDLFLEGNVVLSIPSKPKKEDIALKKLSTHTLRKHTLPPRAIHRHNTRFSALLPHKRESKPTSAPTMHVKGNHPIHTTAVQTMHIEGGEDGSHCEMQSMDECTCTADIEMADAVALGLDVEVASPPHTPAFDEGESPNHAKSSVQTMMVSSTNTESTLPRPLRRLRYSPKTPEMEEAKSIKRARLDLHEASGQGHGRQPSKQPASSPPSTSSASMPSINTQPASSAHSSSRELPMPASSSAVAPLRPSNSALSCAAPSDSSTSTGVDPLSSANGVQEPLAPSRPPTAGRMESPPEAEAEAVTPSSSPIVTPSTVRPCATTHEHPLSFLQASALQSESTVCPIRIPVPKPDLDALLEKTPALDRTFCYYDYMMKREQDEATAHSSPDTSLVFPQYLVKWKHLSHMHCTWVPESRIEEIDPLRWRMFKAYQEKRALLKQLESQRVFSVTLHTKLEELRSLCEEEGEMPSEPTEERAEDPGKQETVKRVPEKILDQRLVSGLPQYYVKWGGLQHDSCTWELEYHIKDSLEEIWRFLTFAHGNHLLPRTLTPGPYTQHDTQPDYIPKSQELHPYQLEGLNWLRRSWHGKTNVILADEMGLGKTIQTIAFLSFLLHEQNIPGPNLVIAPLSTLANWEREFKLWCPQMNVCLYHGTKAARKTLHKQELRFDYENGSNTQALSHWAEGFRSWPERACLPAAGKGVQAHHFNVLVVSYDLVRLNPLFFQRTHWATLTVDEGHRLKSSETKIFQTLQPLRTDFRLMLTGTPLQNNMEELFNLLNFIQPERFPSLEAFQTQFSSLDNARKVEQLHELLTPHLLRRVKKDVFQSLPAKCERVVRVDLSKIQRALYRMLLTRNYGSFNRELGGPRVALQNVLMQLRKCCNHPYLVAPRPCLRSASEDLDHLVSSSGKVALLDRMLLRLKAQGHRVLLFSQFTSLLNILEEYVRLREWAYERIDGQVLGVERQRRIDAFNAAGSADFIFLISTRAGGLGINLATADTVILYDSDWNPHQDLQALSRCHRIGQRSKVMVYRFISRHTAEEKVLQTAKRKMLQEHLVLNEMQNRGRFALTDAALDQILRYGAEEIFKKDDDREDSEAPRAGDIVYDDAQIAQLLDRSQVEDEEGEPDTEQPNLEFSHSYRVAAYTTRSNSTVAASVPRDAFWDNLLKQRYLKLQKEKRSDTLLGRGKRRCKQRTEGFSYQEEEGEEAWMARLMRDDDNDSDSGVETEKDDDEGPMCGSDGKAVDYWMS